LISTPEQVTKPIRDVVVCYAVIIKKTTIKME